MATIIADNIKVKSGNNYDVTCNDKFCTIKYDDNIEFTCSKINNPKSYELLSRGDQFDNIEFKRLYKTSYKTIYEKQKTSKLNSHKPRSFFED